MQTSRAIELFSLARSFTLSKRYLVSDFGKGLFAEVVAIRDKRARGKKLDKSEQAFARENPDLIGTAVQMTSEEDEFFKRLGV